MIESTKRFVIGVTVLRRSVRDSIYPWSYLLYMGWDGENRMFLTRRPDGVIFPLAPGLFRNHWEEVVEGTEAEETRKRYWGKERGQ